MVNRHAVVQAGAVVNVILWDETAATWSPPAGCSSVKSDEGAIKDSWDGVKFTKPPPPEPVLPLVDILPPDSSDSGDV